MAFDPTAFQAPSTGNRCMPVVLLLDVSGSMDGKKIDRLYESVKMMIETFASKSSNEELPYKVAIITFGAKVECHTRYTDAKHLTSLPRFYADGMTPLGTALRMAKAMVEDKEETKSRWYKPAVVVVSDGYPNDDWQEPERAFIEEGRSAKCQRLAVAIGNDADENMLKGFVSKPEFFFKAGDADKLVSVFEKVTISIQNDAVTQKSDVDKKNDDKKETASSKVSTTPTTSRRRAAVSDDDEQWI